MRNAYEPLTLEELQRIDQAIISALAVGSVRAAVPGVVELLP